MRKIALVWLTLLFGTVALAQSPTIVPTMTPNWTYTGQVTPTPTPTDIVPTQKATPVPTNNPKFGAGQ